MISGVCIEGNTPAFAPSRFNLNTDQGAILSGHHEVERAPSSEWQHGLKAALKEAMKDRGLTRITPDRGLH